MSQLVNLLLVDDDEVDILAVKRAFRSEMIGNPITVARDGIEALEILRGEGGHDKLPRPYLILLDLNMPRMSGLEFLEVIRKDEDLTKSVVFVFTTSKADEDRTAAYNSHVAGYILKTDLGGGLRKVAALFGGYWRVVMMPD